MSVQGQLRKAGIEADGFSLDLFNARSGTGDGVKIAGTRVLTEQQSAITDLNQTIAGPTIAEVQAISDKVDEILAMLRAHGIIAT